MLECGLVDAYYLLVLLATIFTNDLVRTSASDKPVASISFSVIAPLFKARKKKFNKTLFKTIFENNIAD